MRILLLPLTRRHTLLYAQRLTENEANKPNRLVAWAMARTQKTWADWENSNTKWKKKTVETANRLLDKIDWEEYSVKTVHNPATTTSEKVFHLRINGNLGFGCASELGRGITD